MIRLDEDQLRAVLRDLRSSTGEVLRSLGTLQLGNLSDELKGNLLAEAIRHSYVLDRSLGSLLDLTELSVVELTLDLQEVDLRRLLRHRLATAQGSFLSSGLVVTRLQEESREAPLHPLIADPERIVRMIDLMLEVSSAWSRRQTSIEAISGHSRISTSFVLDGDLVDWQEAWWKGTVPLRKGELAARLDSLRVPKRSFRRDTVQSLQLIHLIAQRHDGKTEQEIDDGRIRLQVNLPVTAPKEALLIGLKSRLRKATAGIANLAVIRLRVPEAERLLSYGRWLQNALFRASDAIFPFPETADLVMIIVDCTPEEIPDLLGRVVELAGPFSAMGSACCPADAITAEELLDQAAERLEQSLVEKVRTEPEY